MGYLGNIPGDKFLTLEKQVFTTSATDTYTLDREVSSPNDLELFLNNVRQEPTEAYSCSGTTLTLASAITSSDSMYCIYQGRSVGTQAPATGSVTNAMLAGSIATSKLADGSTFATTNGITEADQWRLNTDFSASAGDNYLTANLERVDTDSGGYFGTGMTESSGIFSFPSTGYYLIIYNYAINSSGTKQAFANGNMEISTNGGSTYSRGARAFGSIGDNSAGNEGASGSCMMLIDVTDTSLIRVRFGLNAHQSSVNVLGQSDYNGTHMTFIRLGDT